MSLAKQAQSYAVAVPQEAQQAKKPSKAKKALKYTAGAAALTGLGATALAAKRTGAAGAAKDIWDRGAHKGTLSRMGSTAKEFGAQTWGGKDGLKEMPGQVWSKLKGLGGKQKTSALDAVKTATAVQEGIDFDSFWSSEGRGRGPIVTWEGEQTPPHMRTSDQRLERTLEYADAQGLGSGVKSKIREEHERTSALQAIQATARVQ